MKKLLAIALFSVFVSCTPGMHPEYEQNTETVKAFLKLQGEETDVNAQMALIHEELEWQPAFHGSAPIGKEDFKRTFLIGKMLWKRRYIRQEIIYQEFWQIQDYKMVV